MKWQLKRSTWPSMAERITGRSTKSFKMEHVSHTIRNAILVVVSYLFQRKSKHLFHVGRQFSHQRFITVILTHMRQQNGIKW